MPLNPEDAVLRIRGRLASGELPCETCLATWVGRGLGGRCDACGERIIPEELEVECDAPAGHVLRMHRECFLGWQDECASMLKQAAPNANA